MNVFDKSLLADKDAFVAPSASVIGDVQGMLTVLVLDMELIYYSLVHVAKPNLSGKVLPTNSGNNVTVGHRAVLLGCSVEDKAFVGMGDAVVVEKHALVAAGALVRQNTRIPAGEVHAAENAKPSNEIEFEKVLRKKFSRRDEEYDSMLGVVCKTPPELILPDNVLPDKEQKSSQK